MVTNYKHISDLLNELNGQTDFGIPMLTACYELVGSDTILRKLVLAAKNKEFDLLEVCRTYAAFKQEIEDCFFDTPYNFTDFINMIRTIP